MQFRIDICLFIYISLKWDFDKNVYWKLNIMLISDLENYPVFQKYLKNNFTKKLVILHYKKFLISCFCQDIYRSLFIS